MNGLRSYLDFRGYAADAGSHTILASPNGQATAAEPPEAVPGQGDGEGEVDRGLGPLDGPVAAGGLVGDGDPDAVAGQAGRPGGTPAQCSWLAGRRAGADRLPGAWILSGGAVNAAGQPVSATPAACKSPALFASPAWTPCLTSHGIRIAVTYQPTSRYWPLQWTETAIYLAIAFVLAGFCFWRLSRRLT